MSRTKEVFLRRLDALILEGERVVRGAEQPFGAIVAIVSAHDFTKWQNGCLILAGEIGLTRAQWPLGFQSLENTATHALALLGSIRAVRDAVEFGYLLGVEFLVRSEAFESLLEQADYLHAEGYTLAAGVIGRAVLEEHLRKLCDAKTCAPSKAKPTMNDFKDALYKAKSIDTTQMKHIEATAAVGNDCAHNKPHHADDVKRMLRDVRDILLRHPIA
jgi:hypothetical protein